MDNLARKFQTHSDRITHPCRYTYDSQGRNAVMCDSDSDCLNCGWNPVVAKARTQRWLEQNPAPAKWLIGNGQFPE